MGVDLSDSCGFHSFYRSVVCRPLSSHFSRSDVRWKDVSDTWLHRFCPRRSLDVCEALWRVDRAGDVQSLHPISASRQPGTRLRTHATAARTLWRVVGTVAGWSTLAGTARSVPRTPCGHAYGSPRISVCRSNTVAHSLLSVSFPHSDSRRYVHTRSRSLPEILSHVTSLHSRLYPPHLPVFFVYSSRRSIKLTSATCIARTSPLVHTCSRSKSNTMNHYIRTNHFIAHAAVAIASVIPSACNMKHSREPSEEMRVPGVTTLHSIDSIALWH
jgi:hypothetical protein